MLAKKGDYRYGYSHYRRGDEKQKAKLYDSTPAKMQNVLDNALDGA